MSIVSRRIRLAGVFLLALPVSLQAAPSAVARADASLPVRESVSVQRVSEGPVIDGDLGDPVWRLAAAFDDFTQLQPSAGAPPSQRTEVRVLYDARALYIGIRAYDAEPARIVANQLVQGRGVSGDDHVQILLDPLDSARRGYVFFVNPNSVQVDGLSTGDTSWNLNWDGIWDARSRIDEKGWTTEIAIPFRTLSFDPARPDWGMTVVRQVGRTSERQAWTFRDFRASNDALGLITGLRDLEEGRGLDVIPSLAFRERRDFASGRAHRTLEPALDLFYRFTPALIGALTFNTDFSATEVDDRRVNLGRFSLFFPEKREFFLQGADIFEFANLQQNGRPFFSRTIGLSAGGDPVDLVAGGKLTGRLGRWNLGLLGVHQDADGEVDADTLLVARASADVLQASSVGIMATHGDPRSNRESWLVGTDWNFRNTTWLNGQAVEAGAWVQRSGNEGLVGDDLAWGLRLGLPNETLEMKASLVELQRNFRPAMGFVNRRDIRQVDASLFRLWREPVPLLRDWRVGGEVTQVTDLDGRLESSRIRVVPVDVFLAAGDFLNVYWTRERERLERPFAVVGVLEVPPGIYTFQRVGMSFNAAGFRQLRPSLTIEGGEFFDGHRQDLRLGAAWRPNRHLLFDASGSINRLSLASGDFITRLLRLRADVAFNVHWAWTNTLQYDNVSGNFGVSSRLRWVPRLGQSLTLALDHDVLVEDGRRLDSQTRDFGARLSYTFRI